jgi:hypothetical protein
VKSQAISLPSFSTSAKLPGHVNVYYTTPSVVVVTSRFPPRARAEEQVRRAFLCMLEEETTVDPYQ